MVTCEVIDISNKLNALLRILRYTREWDLRIITTNQYQLVSLSLGLGSMLEGASVQYAG